MGRLPSLKKLGLEMGYMMDMSDIGLGDAESSADFSGDRAGVVVTKMDVWSSNVDMRGCEEDAGGMMV